jgi:hypothetical protein
VDFNTSGQQFTLYSEFVKYLRKSGNTMKQCISYSMTSRKPVDQLRGRSCIKILIGSGIPTKLLKLIKMCLNETYSIIRVGKHLSDMFLVKNGLKQGDALSPVFFHFAQ